VTPINEKLNLSVQVLTIITLVIGVALVVYELRQTRELAKVQIISDSYALFVENNLSWLGEEPLEVVAKSCTDPESLTNKELDMLTVFYVQSMNHMMRVKLISEESDVYPDDYWKALASSMSVIFVTKIGRAWWLTYEGADPGVRAIGDAMYDRFKDLPCDTFQSRWLDQYRLLDAEGQPD